jgi:hypothetical protein
MGAVEHELTVDPYPELTPALLELPGGETTSAWLPEVDALAIDEVLL